MNSATSSVVYVRPRFVSVLAQPATSDAAFGEWVAGVALGTGADGLVVLHVAVSVLTADAASLEVARVLTLVLVASL